MKVLNKTTPDLSIVKRLGGSGAAKIRIFSQTNVKMLRLFLYLQQFNVISRLSATISPIIRCKVLANESNESLFSIAECS